MMCQLYRGTIRHVRTKPVRHEFVYPAAFVAVDLETLASGAAPKLGYNRRRGMWIDDRDYLDPDARPIADKLRARFEGYEPSRVVMLTTPRGLLRAFNPLTCYFGCDGAGAVTGLAAEVANTYRERFIYTPAVQARGEGRFTAETSKEMYVSPFHGIKGVYRFSGELSPGRAEVSVSLVVEEETVIFAQVKGEGRPLKDAGLADLAAIVATGALALPRIAAQALRLRAKGLRPVMKPHAPPGAVRRA